MRFILIFLMLCMVSCASNGNAVKTQVKPAPIVRVAPNVYAMTNTPSGAKAKASKNIAHTPRNAPNVLPNRTKPQPSIQHFTNNVSVQVMTPHETQILTQALSNPNTPIVIVDPTHKTLPIVTNANYFKNKANFTAVKYDKYKNLRLVSYYVVVGTVLWLLRKKIAKLFKKSSSPQVPHL